MATLAIHSPSRPPRPLPRNEEDFERYMREMDEDFIKRKVPVPGRSIAALVEVSRDEGKEEGRFMPLTERVPQTYEGDDLRLRIKAWYEQRYGDALKVSLGPGSTVVNLRGAVWEYHMPAAGGPALFFARDIDHGPAMLLEGDKITWLSPGHALRRGTSLQKVDTVDGVVHLPSGIIPLLSYPELHTLVKLFILDWRFLHWLASARHYPLIRSSRVDLAAAVRHLVANPAELGQARWAIQQGTEKALKALLDKETGQYPTRGREAHDLVALSELAGATGTVRFRPEHIRRIACKPGVRYGEEDAGTLTDGADIFRIALAVSGIAARILLHRHPVKAPRVTGGSPGDGFESVRDYLDMLWELGGVPIE